LQFEGSYVFEDLGGPVPLIYPKTLQFYITIQFDYNPFTGRRYLTALLPEPWVDKKNMVALYTYEKLTRSSNETVFIRVGSLRMPEHEEYF